MAVTNAGSTSLSFLNIPVGIQVTKITDTSADWASVANSTYFYDKGDGLVHYKNSGGVVLELFSAGGLTYFTEGENTAAPNGTVYVDSLTAAGSTTNVDIAIVPKGTGAFMLDIPDNTTTGGNKRGAGAVDLQTSRSSAGQVASGTASFTAGRNNTASNTAAVSIGDSCVSSAAYAFSANGSTTASGANSVALCRDTIASGTDSFAANIGNVASGIGASVFGQYNTADSRESVAFGIYGGTQGAHGAISHSTWCTTGVFSYTRRFVLTKLTTSATTAEVYYNTYQLTYGSDTTVNLKNQAVIRFKGTVVGKKQGATDVAAWDIDGLIVRGANAASTTLNVSNVNLVQNTPAWGTPTLSADTTNGCLKIQVTGAASTNIVWTCSVETTEVIYA